MQGTEIFPIEGTDSIYPIGNTTSADDLAMQRARASAKLLTYFSGNIQAAKGCTVQDLSIFWKIFWGAVCYFWVMLSGPPFTNMV